MPADVAEMLLLERPAPAEFVSRFQQTTPPVVAKGVEDTAFYRYGRLLALCDVGGDPGRFGISAQRFHDANAERARRFPQAMLTTMTHDTKRSSDVRARITALTWIADEWSEAVGCVAGGDRRAALRRRRPRRPRALLPVSDAGGRVADRARADRGLHGEGAARGQAQHQLGRSERRLGERRARLLPGAVLPRARSLRDVRAVRRAAAAARGDGRAAHGRAEADRRPACPTSTRATSCRCARSSTPTTAGRSTGSGTRRCSPGWRAAPTRTPPPTPASCG